MDESEKTGPSSKIRGVKKNNTATILSFEGGGVETLFGRIPFEQHLCYTGSSLITQRVLANVCWRQTLL